MQWRIKHRKPRQVIIRSKLVIIRAKPQLNTNQLQIRFCLFKKWTIQQLPAHRHLQYVPWRRLCLRNERKFKRNTLKFKKTRTIQLDRPTNSSHFHRILGIQPEYQLIHSLSNPIRNYSVREFSQNRPVHTDELVFIPSRRIHIGDYFFFNLFDVYYFYHDKRAK